MKTRKQIEKMIVVAVSNMGKSADLIQAALIAATEHSLVHGEVSLLVALKDAVGDAGADSVRISRWLAANAPIRKAESGFVFSKAARAAAFNGFTALDGETPEGYFERAAAAYVATLPHWKEATSAVTRRKADSAVFDGLSELDKLMDKFAKAETKGGTNLDLVRFLRQAKEAYEAQASIA